MHIPVRMRNMFDASDWQGVYIHTNDNLLPKQTEAVIIAINKKIV